ncbi:MAG TPA: cupin domain-containing protein [Candidatus Dormibacteraeota bacterium]
MSRGRVIENPASGERIVVRQTGAETGGELLAFDLFLAPGGRVPSSHVHPEQEETFTVLEGRMRFRIGLRSRLVGPGETVRVPPGAVHAFANVGREPAHLLVEARPALNTEEMLGMAAGLDRPWRRPLQLAVFLEEFVREVRVPFVPAPLVRAVTLPLAWLAARR